jgi:hypothetical protein
VETIVVPNINVITKGILIRSTTKLGSRLSGVLARKNLSWSLELPTITTWIVSILQMVFTNPIMTTHGNKTTNRPLMNLMVVGRCRSTDIVHLRRGYWEPIVVIAPILDHKDGHYVKPNKVTFKYPDFKKDIDPYVHVKVFNFAIKTNAETSKEYIINAFNYTLKNIKLN